MKNRPLLICVMLLLVAAAIAFPFLLTRVPLPLRLAASLINLLAALGIGTLLRQNGGRRR
jgi:hypothetical protein